jgi:hypothetical protein
LDRTPAHPFPPHGLQDLHSEKWISEAFAPQQSRSPAPQIPFKRPRGRPRKNPPPAATAQIQSLLGDKQIPSQTSSSPTIQPPAKRPRGRPRKNPFPSTMDQIAAIIAQADVQPVKRPRGRPRKHPVSTAPAASTVAKQKKVDSFAAPAAGPVASYPESAPVPSSPVPPRISHRTAPVGASKRRGRPPKDRVPPFTIAPGGQSPFCAKCGTYLKLFKPKRGRWRRVCPRCQPGRLIETRDPRFNLDKTGMPCKDRGKCRPERCIKALECSEMARKGTIRGAARGTGG